MAIKKRSSGETMPAGAFGPRHPGRIITYATKYGQVAAKWPRKRPRVSATTREQMQLFKQLAEDQKNQPADVVAAARLIAEGTKWTWRDVIGLQLTGRLFTIPGWGFNVAQYTLDVLGDQPGMILYRGLQQWTVLPKGNNNEVLTLIGGFPAWQPSQGTPGAGPPFHPGFVSSRLYMPPFAGTTANGTAAADTLYAIPLYVPVETTIRNLSIQVQAAITGGQVALGIYDNLAGEPAGLLVDAGVIAAATFGQKTSANFDLVVQPGWVWLAVLNKVAGTMILVSATGPASAMQIGIAGLVNGGAPYSHVRRSLSFGSGALPDPFGTAVPTSGAYLAVAFTVP